jgi:hypothetical protein
MSNIIVPRRYSRVGMLTAHLFLLNGVVSFSQNCESIGILGFPLYLSTLTYWYEIRKDSNMKYLDMFIATINILYVSYVSLFFFYEGNPFIRNISIMVFVYIFNIIIYQYQVINEKPENITKSVSDLLDKRLTPYRYFSLEFTEPFTNKRHRAYQYSVLVHLLFLHALPTITCMYCLIETERRKNMCWPNPENENENSLF